MEHNAESPAKPPIAPAEVVAEVGTSTAAAENDSAAAATTTSSTVTAAADTVPVGVVEPIPTTNNIFLSGGALLAAGAMPGTVPATDSAAYLNALPTREYLNQTVSSLVLRGLLILARERPKDPLRFLAMYLLKHKNESQEPFGDTEPE